MLLYITLTGICTVACIGIVPAVDKHAPEGLEKTDWQWKPFVPLISKIPL